MQQMQPQMYDRTSTVFSPDGRLYQVEYAREAVKRGTTAIGIKYNNGAFLLVDKRVTSKLIEIDSIEKIFQIDRHIGAATSGLIADARALIDKARVEAQINKVTYDEPIGVEVLSKKICDHKQTFTQYGGVRPYGTSLIIIGIDGKKIRLFETDPSGAMLEYKATAIGSGRNIAIEYFESKYKENIEFQEAFEIGLEALYKIANGKLDPQTLEGGIITLDTCSFKIIDKEIILNNTKKIIEKNNELLLDKNIKEEEKVSEEEIIIKEEDKNLIQEH